MKRILPLFAAALMAAGCSGQFNADRAMMGGVKAMQAATITDAQVQAYVRESINQMDAQNKVLPENSSYTKRLRQLTSGLTQVEGIPLNFKVYQTSEVNAFACADGSVRVYTGLMDLMTDNEVLGVIGHEIGHVALKHSKKQMKQAILTSALRDGIASTGGTIAALSDTSLGDIGEALMSAQYSQKQEKEADDYGYSFLKAAGKNPWALALAFEKLDSMSTGSSAGKSAGGSSSVSRLFSTHPDTVERIERISKRATSEGFTRPAK